jgi:ABC-type dipeptide/oligopeptide/nickel transport system permease component
MLRFFARRGISMVFVLFSLTFLTFIIGHLAPGDPILVLMGPRQDPGVYARLRHLYGLDQPLLTQYVNYVRLLVRGDLGLSFSYEGRPVRELIEQGLPISFGVGGLALVVSLILLIWMANLAIFRAGYPNLPQAGWGTPSHIVLPVLVLAAANVGYITQLTRASMLEVLRDDYVRTARAKGLFERTVIVRHVLRNALLPLITLLGPTTAFLVTGAFVVEVLFNIPGIGRIAVEAVGRRDYPVIQGTTIILGIAVVIMNLVSDLLYHVFDPRIQLTD